MVEGVDGSVLTRGGDALDHPSDGEVTAVPTD